MPSIDDEFVEATLDHARAHVCLILLGTLTMSESKSVLLSAFLALQEFCPEDVINWFMSLGGRLESRLARQDAVISRRPMVEAAHRVTKEKLADNGWPNWSDP